MTIGEYIRDLRNAIGLSQRELAEKCGVSNAEICRIETGKRKNVSPAVLKKLSSSLNVPYMEMLKKAGYIVDEVKVDYSEEKFYIEEDGEILDIVKKAKDIYERDSQWLNIAFRVIDANLSKEDLEIITVMTTTLFELLLKSKSKKKMAD
jgi:transcriptional regulator with XRE-family HTH domain